MILTTRRYILSSLVGMVQNSVLKQPSISCLVSALAQDSSDFEASPAGTEAVSGSREKCRRVVAFVKDCASPSPGKARLI